MNRVFVAERNGLPITLNEIHVEALPSPSMANARMQVTPIPRLKTERVVPYVSVLTLEDLLILSDQGSDLRDELVRLIADAMEGIEPT